MGAADRVFKTTETQPHVGGAVDEVHGHRAGSTAEIQGVGGGGGSHHAFDVAELIASGLAACARTRDGVECDRLSRVAVVHSIGALATIDGVGAAAAFDGVVAVAGGDGVVLVVGGDHEIGCLAGDELAWLTVDVQGVSDIGIAGEREGLERGFTIGADVGHGHLEVAGSSSSAFFPLQVQRHFVVRHARDVQRQRRAWADGLAVDGQAIRNFEARLLVVDVDQQ